MVGDVAEHDHAQDRDEDQQRVAVGLHGAGLGIVQGLDQRVVSEGAQYRDGDQQAPSPSRPASAIASGPTRVVAPKATKADQTSVVSGVSVREQRRIRIW